MMASRVIDEGILMCIARYPDVGEPNGPCMVTSFSRMPSDKPFTWFLISLKAGTSDPVTEAFLAELQAQLLHRGFPQPEVGTRSLIFRNVE